MIQIDGKVEFYMIYSRNLHDDNKPYLTEFTNGQEGVEPIISDSSDQRGSNMSPSELLQAALAGCTNMTARELLVKRNIPYEDVLVDVKMEHVDGNTVFIRSIKINSPAPDEVLQQVIEDAQKCYVGRILMGEIKIKDE